MCVHPSTPTVELPQTLRQRRLEGRDLVAGELAAPDLAVPGTQEWGADKRDEVWAGIHHLRPVGCHSALQQALALLMRLCAEAHGLVPVLGAFEPRRLDDHRRERNPQTGSVATRPRPRRWPSR